MFRAGKHCCSWSPVSPDAYVVCLPVQHVSVSVDCHMKGASVLLVSCQLLFCWCCVMRYGGCQHNGLHYGFCHTASFHLFDSCYSVGVSVGNTCTQIQENRNKEAAVWYLSFVFRACCCSHVTVQVRKVQKCSRIGFCCLLEFSYGRLASWYMKLRKIWHLEMKNVNSELLVCRFRWEAMWRGEKALL